MRCSWLKALTCLLGATAVAGCATTEAGPSRADGQSRMIGDSRVYSYAEFDAEGNPAAVGVAYAAGALDGLPPTPSDHHHCVDRDRDGSIDRDSECAPTHEAVIPLPDAVATRDDMPFKWVLFNWNPLGHIPPGIYDVPHFDLHFYIESITNTFAIKDGMCGPDFVDCGQFEIAKRPLPANYMPPDYQDLDAVAPAMGNHLVDLTGPEFNGETWTRSFIFGIYDAEITFYEEMVSLEYLRGQPDACSPIKSPPAVAVAGYYPTQSCIRYDAERNEHSVSMEGFEYREASAPEAPAE